MIAKKIKRLMCSNLKYQIGEKVKFKSDVVEVYLSGKITDSAYYGIFIVHDHQEMNDMHGTPFYRYILKQKSRLISMVKEDDLISLNDLRKKKIKNLIK